ncbi:VOC family protein [Bordetella genomosp. 1]|uniref:Drug:proton antiporter n=1 Tax=Bordetella genomosp. 1 TaxID=1395607 RepID=A0ABX4EXH2_9BORD|nr:VOC family protein [Bordetella genomosp. 1]MDQ8035201.1 VOC family protein [Bordetella sp.]OZI63776.1 drug:proton antiporter [Bordetella genomosp. 1]
MIEPSFTILYVDSPAASTAFYRAVLQREPVEASPTFAMFALDSGLRLGLWARHTVQPTVRATAGATELGFVVTSADEVDRAHAAWSEHGLTILQAPTDMDFGRSFVALDPDGHRLRVFHPA